MKSDPTTRDNTRYCEFHRDYGHRTDDCIHKKEIEYLIRRGYLRHFIAPENQPQNQAQNQDPAQQPPPPPRHTTAQQQQPLGEIHVIFGRICRKRGIQLSQEGPSAQHQVRRDSGSTSGVQTASARHVHNVL